MPTTDNACVQHRDPFARSSSWTIPILQRLSDSVSYTVVTCGNVITNMCHRRRAILEGNDSRVVLAQYYDAFNSQIVQAQHKVVHLHTVDTSLVDIVWFGGGDMKYTSVITGLGGRFGGKGKCCPWCEETRDNLGNQDVNAHKENVPQRTLARSYHMTHTSLPDHVRPAGQPKYGFTCPGCMEVITEEKVLSARS